MQFGKLVDGKPTYTSPSQLSSMNMCGEKYRLERLVQVKQDNAWWNAGGSAVHAATEMFDRTWWEEECPADWHKKITPAEVDETFNMCLDAEISDWDMSANILSSRGQTEDWWRENGPDMVQNYLDFITTTGWKIWTKGDTPGIEYKVDVLLNKTNEDTRILGFIDRVYDTGNGNLIVADIKTGSRKPGNKLQLGIYTAGLLLQEGLEVDLGAYLMVRKPLVHKATPTVDLSEWTPFIAEKYVTNMRRILDAEAYLPNVSGFCNACSVKEFCWAYKAESNN